MPGGTKTRCRRRRPGRPRPEGGYCRVERVDVKLHGSVVPVSSPWADKPRTVQDSQLQVVWEALSDAERAGRRQRCTRAPEAGRCEARLYPTQPRIPAKQLTEVVSVDVIRRVDAPRPHVLAVLVVKIVVDGEQQPTRPHRVEQPADGVLTSCLGQRRVLHRHQVERSNRKRHLEDVPADPPDLDASQFCGLSRPAHRHRGDVDRGDTPAAAEQARSRRPPRRNRHREPGPA